MGRVGGRRWWAARGRRLPVPCLLRCLHLSLPARVRPGSLRHEGAVQGHLQCGCWGSGGILTEIQSWLW